MYDAVKDANALVILTEWPEFSAPDFSLLEKTMKQKIIFDLRNMLSSEEALKYKFKYHCIGRKSA